MADETFPYSRGKHRPIQHQAEAEALFSSIGDGAISTDEFGKITRVNPAAQALLGYSEKELLGSWFPKLITALSLEGEVINLIDRPITRAFLTGKPVSAKMFYRRKDGRRMPVAVNVSPILFNNRPTGAIELFRDITLEQEIDRMKSEFISLASHQLRTPLSAIKTYTHMLSDGYMGELNEAQLKALGTIINSSNRMNELISTLLNITRIESGSVEIIPKTFKLDEIIKELLDELTLMADNKSIDLRLKTIGKGSLTLKTDSLIVKEILANLMSNAIKYTPNEGQVDILLKPRRDDILVEVRDSGWGIPKYAQDQVFSKFFRAPNIVKRETTGTGLGLYLVRGLLDTLEGDIWFSSDESKGTSFFLTLPRHSRQQKAKPTNKRKPASKVKKL